jgi:hypothetical protein
VDSTEHERVLIFIFSLNFALFFGYLQKLFALQIIKRHVNGHLYRHYTVVAHDREVAKSFEGADGAFSGRVLHKFLVFGREHIESVCSVQEVNWREVHRDERVNQRRWEHRNISHLSDSDDKALPSDRTNMFSDREPRNCQHQKHMHTIEADGLFDIIGLVLDLWVVLDEELKHELLL